MLLGHRNQFVDWYPVFLVSQSLLAFIFQKYVPTGRFNRQTKNTEYQPTKKTPVTASLQC